MKKFKPLMNITLNQILSNLPGKALRVCTVPKRALAISPPKDKKKFTVRQLGLCTLA